ncbi:MAG: hypothetical protein AB1746_13545 [Candidatus Zixiibacteriota bacterium]
MIEKKVLSIIYTNIGRGHPFYLDGTIRHLEESYGNKIQLNIVDVFELSSGISLQLWRTVRSLYHYGSQGGIIGHIYNSIRKGNAPNRKNMILNLMAGGIRRYIQKNPFPALVAHPLLVPMISDLTTTYYQHGENAVPAEAIVRGVRKIYVPTSRAAMAFIENGIEEDSIIQTGLCIEEGLALKAGEFYNERLARLNRNNVLTGGFFSSGAEPKQHIHKIVLMISSLMNSNQKAIVFCRKGGKLESILTHRMGFAANYSSMSPDDIRLKLASTGILVFSFNNRREEDILVESLFPFLDYFVAPSHERTNWTLGLGLPMFILHPIIGTFSPLNRTILLENRVAVDIENDRRAADFISILLSLSKRHILADMARSGFGRFDVFGFMKTASHLAGDLMV